MNKKIERLFRYAQINKEYYQNEVKRYDYGSYNHGFYSGRLDVFESLVFRLSEDFPELVQVRNEG